jgi:hypothetical protein
VPHMRLYVVERFARRGTGLPLEQTFSVFRSEDEAIQDAQQHLSACSDGVRVVSITGDPVLDRWELPEVLMTAGLVPVDEADRREDESAIVVRLLRASRDLAVSDPERSGLLRRAAEDMMQVGGRHQAGHCGGRLH